MLSWCYEGTAIDWVVWIRKQQEKAEEKEGETVIRRSTAGDCSLHFTTITVKFCISWLQLKIVSFQSKISAWDPRNYKVGFDYFNFELNISGWYFEFCRPQDD